MDLIEKVTNKTATQNVFLIIDIVCIIYVLLVLILQMYWSNAVKKNEM